MTTTRPPEQGPEWLESGFPPRSFPPEDAPPLPPGPPVRGRNRGKAPWLAAVAVLAVVLLLGVGLVLATRGDGGGPRVATGTSTSSSAVDANVSTSSPIATLPATIGSTGPVNTTTSAPTTTGVAVTSLSPGVLEPTTGTVVLPKSDPTTGTSRATLTLRNTGSGALSYTAQSSSPGLVVTPTRGTIGPGTSSDLNVTLDAAKVDAEGPFVGTLAFAGTGGTKTVQVQSTVGRPPKIVDDVGEGCAPASAMCSRQIRLAPTSTPDPTPCNTPWLYAVTVTDQSRIQSARAIARRGLANADAALQRGGTSDIFLSDPIEPISPGTVHRFTIEAVDQYGFLRRLPEQTITCP